MYNKPYSPDRRVNSFGRKQWLTVVSRIGLQSWQKLSDFEPHNLLSFSQLRFSISGKEEKEKNRRSVNVISDKTKRETNKHIKQSWLEERLLNGQLWITVSGTYMTVFKFWLIYKAGIILWTVTFIKSFIIIVPYLNPEVKRIKIRWMHCYDLKHNHCIIVY